MSLASVAAEGSGQARMMSANRSITERIVTSTNGTGQAQKERPERYESAMVTNAAPKIDSTTSDRASEFDFEGTPRRPTGKGERLALAIRVRYPSIAEFARASGIQEGVVRQHIHRSTIPAKYLTTYVRFLKVTAEWLLDGRGIGPVTNPEGKPAAPSLERVNPTYPDRKALSLAISAVEIMAKLHPLTDEQRADLIADLTPVLRERIARILSE